MTSSANSLMPERNTTEPSDKNASDTVPTESGDHPVPSESALASDSLYNDALQQQKIGAPGIPFFTERPPRSNESQQMIAVEDPKISHISGSHKLNIEEQILKALLANGSAMASDMPPDMDAEYLKAAKKDPKQD